MVRTVAVAATAFVSVDRRFSVVSINQSNIMSIIIGCHCQRFEFFKIQNA
jgi:hypothetical protein